MKTFTAVAAVVMLAASAFGQGQIFFNNRTVQAPVYGVDPRVPLRRVSGMGANFDGIPLLYGTNYTAQLWYGPEGSPVDALQPLTTPQGTVTFRPAGSFDGFIQQTAAAATLDGIPFGATASLQMRVWDNRGGLVTSWAAAITDPAAAQGYSDVFISAVLVPPPDVPPGMVGLTSFNLQIPEPSVVALGAVCLGALLLRRRS